MVHVMRTGLIYGLLIRPSGAVHTGSMFWYLYLDKAQKSIGYSSLSGSHCGNGIFLALFDVHVIILHHTSSCYSLSDSVLKRWF
jgi:hypothetical protein